MTIEILPYDAKLEIQKALYSGSSSDREALYQIALMYPAMEFTRGSETFCSKDIIAAYEENVDFT